MILLGHNGAGKSTLINYLLGFYVDVKQHPFLPHFQEHISPLSRENLGYAPEVALLDNALNASDYFKLVATLKGIKNYDMDYSLKQVALNVGKSVPIKTYSKGMRQRLLLALSILGDNHTIILDEPTNSLDPYGQEAVEQLLISLKEKHYFIVGTHSLKLAHSMNKEIWILKGGKIVHKTSAVNLSTLEELVFKYRPEYIQ